MNAALLLRRSWHITWRNGLLWLINLFAWFTFLPAAVLLGGMVSVANLLALPFELGEAAWLTTLRRAPISFWLFAVGGGLMLLVTCTALTWLLQAAAVRGAALAAECGTVTWREAWRLGPRRVGNILKLSATLGLVIAMLSWLPPVLVLLLRDELGWGRALVQGVQASLAPVNTLIGLAVFVVMMAIALEDLAPTAAARRAWAVFRTGWWGFLLVTGLSALPALPLVLLLAPLVAVVPLAVLTDWGWLVLAAGVVVLVPLAVGLLLFAAVYTLVLYTLIYRAAAGRTLALS